MANPTNFRVEATSPTDVTLRWTDGDVTPVLIYRSTDGVSFSLLTAVAAGVQIYEDTDVNGLVGGTKYWYELSQDGGSTFTDSETVWTHECPDFTKLAPTPGIPSFHVENNPESLNVMGEIVALKYGQNLRSTAFQGNGQPAFEDQCIICAEDGKIVLDCSSNCRAYLIVTTVDINSITIIGCGGVCPPVSFLVPTDTCVGICGWPAECKNHGDDCFYGTLCGGSAGGGTTGGEWGGSTGGAQPNEPGGGNEPDPDCPCTGSGLSVTCCEDTCCVDCSGDQCVRFKICGGTGPFTVSSDSGTVNHNAGGRHFSLCASVSNESVAGNAYKWSIKFCTTFTDCRCQDFGCDGESNSSCGNTGCAVCGLGCSCASCASCENIMGCVNLGSNCVSCCDVTQLADACGALAGIHKTCDSRSQDMIDDGCNPCVLQFAPNSAAVTVTDAMGNSIIVAVPECSEFDG